MSTRAAAAVRPFGCPHPSRVSSSGPLGTRRHPSRRREVSVCRRFPYIGRCRRRLPTRSQDLGGRPEGPAAAAQIKLSKIFVPHTIFAFPRSFQVIRFPEAQREGATLADEASEALSDAGPDLVTNEVAVWGEYQVTRYAQFPTNEGRCGMFPIRHTPARSLAPPEDKRLPAV